MTTSRMTLPMRAGSTIHRSFGIWATQATGFWLTIDLRKLDILYWHNWTFGNRGVKFVSRPPADLRISLKQRGGPTYRIELIRVPFTR